MSAQPRVTVVLVCTEAEEVENGPMMHALHSVEQQDYPRDLVDTHIVRNLYGAPLGEMRKVGAQHADTELVAFIDAAQVWPANMLSELVRLALDPTNPLDYSGVTYGNQLDYGGVVVGFVGNGYGIIARRVPWLERMAS